MPAQANPLKDLEVRLNRDAALQGEFLKDPVKVLKREGMEVTPDMARAIKAQMAELGVAKIDKLAAKPKIGIKITITIKF